ncbi:N-acetyltransferase [Chryseobacterium joostei]|uniref:N-acetylglutamate synthase, GNAT family n=1 Tax=Chryseobacterium joostei TaxID=112234 RepID=A0A1N7I0U0_9FLAO|nr:GNAT family N-acetyltransferase [Chryseobacterium joostei]AZA99384.1 N-acetyltransferase [Chryseobacterium joostei]SIS30683.1 N-acetylglutamate synthase, GNAT family [Chryseobacterium joostei]SIS46613.1 N-acetylglutamate synthase, GNAT family [Chryseobacterium joostei]
MKIIQYTKIFRKDCIEIFNSNVPKFFSPEELPLFESFLDDDTEENYFVVKMDGPVIGCGGFFLNAQNNIAGLSWGMIHSNYHGKGIGRALTQYRIDLLKQNYPTLPYKIETSQHTAEFYQKNGFKTVEIVPDGFGKGIDKYTMIMEVMQP